MCPKQRQPPDGTQVNKFVAYMTLLVSLKLDVNQNARKNAVWNPLCKKDSVGSSLTSLVNK